MDTRKLLFGLGLVAIVVGLLLAAFTPGGWFNQGASGGSSMITPFGSFEVTASASRSSVWPVVGYVLMAAGTVSSVVGFSPKSPRSDP